MNSEPRFWKGKIFPTLFGGGFQPSVRQTIRHQPSSTEKNTQATMAAAPKMTAQRH